jgi:hypothetical protein
MCQDEFDPVTRVPQVLPCGHTFCKVCIAHTFHSTGVISCLNCVYKTNDISQMITNHILLDRTSLKGNVGFDQAPTFFGTRNFDTNFYSSRSFHNISSTNTRSQIIEEGVGKTNAPLINDFNIGLNARDFESDSRTKPFFGTKKCGNIGCQKIAIDEFCSDICASFSAMRRRNTPSPTPARLNNSAHTFARITPFKASLSGKETPQAIISNVTPRSVKNNLNVSFSSGISTTKKLNNQSPFTPKLKCRNPNCDNPRYNFGSFESDYCGKMCAEAFGVRFML